MVVFADYVHPQAAEALTADRTQLLLSGVHRLVAAQVCDLCEAPPTGGAGVRPDFLVHQLVALQVVGVVESLWADVTNECLLKVGHPVRLEHADAGEAPPTDVTVAALLTCVTRLHVQVSVSLVVEPLRAVAASVPQKCVFFYLMFTEFHDASERSTTHRAKRVELLLVVSKPLAAGKHHAAAQTLQVSLCSHSDQVLSSPAAVSPHSVL